MHLHLIEVVVVLHYLATLNHIGIWTLIERMHQKACVVARVVHDLVVDGGLLLNVVRVLVDAADVVVRSDLRLDVCDAIHPV